MAVDFAKVTQMLDSGWLIYVFKNDMGSYTATAKHGKRYMIARANKKFIASVPVESRELAKQFIESNRVETDDFTPEQALTRLAYKVHGEVI